MLERVEANIRANDLIAPGGEVLCLVAGGPDSTCLHVVLRELGYDVSALHVNYGLRGRDSDDDARFCERELGAEIVEFDARGASEAELRAIRYAQAPERLRATGHTASDQVETILYRLVTSGNTKGIKAKRDDDKFAHVAAWEYRGEGQKPLRNVEPLTFEYVHPTQRSIDVIQPGVVAITSQRRQVY